MSKAVLAAFAACAVIAAAQPALADARSVCSLPEVADGESVVVTGEIRLEGESPVQISQGVEANPAPKGEPGRLLLTSPDCPDLTVTVAMSRRFHQSMLAFAFYMTLDMPHYRSGEQKQRVVLRGVWNPSTGRLTDADLINME